MRKGEILATTMAAAALVSCDSPDVHRNTGGPFDIMQAVGDVTSSLARTAIAKQYETCEITDVTEVGSRVDVTIRTTKSEISEFYRKLLSKDSTKPEPTYNVTWDIAKEDVSILVQGQKGEAAMGRPVRGPGMMEILPEDPTVTIPVNPPANLSRNAMLGVYIGQDAGSVYPDKNKAYFEYGAKFCGAIAVVGAEDDGVGKWEVVPMNDPGEVYITRECEVSVTDPAAPFIDNCHRTN